MHFASDSCFSQMFITLSSDYINLIAMLKTTPLVVTVGLSLTIPFALVGDWTFFAIVPQPGALAGAVLVIGAFIALGTEEEPAESVSTRRN